MQKCFAVYIIAEENLVLSENGRERYHNLMTTYDPQNKTGSNPPCSSVPFLRLLQLSVFAICLHIRAEDTAGNFEKPKLVKMISVTT